MTTILIFGAAVLPDGNPSATLRHRVEAALAYAKDRPNVRFIPTGARGRYGPPEAAVMAGLLMKSGVPSNKILLEDEGADTWSSVRAIWRILRRDPAGGPVVVVSSAYHLPRCVILLCILGISPLQWTHPQVTASRSFRKRWYWRLREIPAIPYDSALALIWRLRGDRMS